MFRATLCSSSGGQIVLNCNKTCRIKQLTPNYVVSNINDTMTILKQVNKTSLLLPYEQIYIQLLHHNNELIREQHLNEHNPMFELIQHKYRTSHPT